MRKLTNVEKHRVEKMLDKFLTTFKPVFKQIFNGLTLCNNSIKLGFKHSGSIYYYYIY